MGSTWQLVGAGRIGFGIPKMRPYMAISDGYCTPDGCRVVSVHVATRTEATSTCTEKPE
jgi:hypothetical protein